MLQRIRTLMDSLSNVKKILFDSRRVDVAIDEINKKIHTLRTQFFKDYAKVKKSLVSGAGTGDIYIPKLWCYALLKFLVTSDPVRYLSSNLDMENVNPFKNSKDVMPGCSGYKPNPFKTLDFMQQECTDQKLNEDEVQGDVILYDGPGENLEKGVYITPPAKKIKKAQKNTMEKEAIQLLSNASNVPNNLTDNQKTKHAKEVAAQEDIQAFGSVIIEEPKKINNEEEMRMAKREILNSVLNAQERAAAKHK